MDSRTSGPILVRHVDSSALQGGCTKKLIANALEVQPVSHMLSVLGQLGGIAAHKPIRSAHPVSQHSGGQLIACACASVTVLVLQH